MKQLKAQENSNWYQATLGDFVGQRGKSVQPSKFPDQLFELYSVPSHLSGVPENIVGKEIGSNKQTVEPSSVLLCGINPRINRVWVVNEQRQHIQIASTEWIVFPPSAQIWPKFLCYFLQQDEFRQFLASNASGVGGSLMRVKASTLRDYPFAFPPIDEQKNLVSEIEKHFTRLDAGMAALQRAQANLKRYRAAVLKAACEGKLVPTEAELAGADGRSYESGAELLQRILAERRAKWNGRGKYKEPVAPDVSGLPELPAGWTWATPDQLSQVDENAICAGPFGTIFKAKDFRDSGIPIIFLRHVAAGKYLTDKPGYMDKSKWQELFQSYSVFGGELLITKLGDPPGVCATYPEGIGPAMVTPDVIKISVNQDAIRSKFLMNYLNSEIARNFSSGVAFGTTRMRLTIPIFRSMPVPLPPMAEQQCIVAEVERRLSITDEMEAAVSANLQRGRRLRQAILHRVFTQNSQED